MPDIQLKRTDDEFIKSRGVHYTPLKLADFLVNEIFRNSTYFSGGSKDLISILEPACGDGSLIIPFIKRLNEVLPPDVDVKLTLVDLDETFKETILENVYREMDQNRIKVDFIVCDFIEYALNTINGSLFDRSEKFDVIISNPPFVRTHNMTRQYSHNLAKSLNIPKRFDLSHAFIKICANLVSEDGVYGVICSNKITTNKNSKDLRKLLDKQFDGISIFDFGDSKLFSAAVLPCVMILTNTKNSKSLCSMYELNSPLVGDEFIKCENLCEIFTAGDLKEFDGVKYKVKCGELKFHSGNDVWYSEKDNNEHGFSEIVKKNTVHKFGDIGKVRVGVKTTADSVFIRRDWGDVNPLPENLRPIIKGSKAKRYKNSLEEFKILYTHTSSNGRATAIDLEKYPATKEYLEVHRTILEARTYVTDAGRNWYEIWVPQDPDLWHEPKLIFRDISSQPIFWIDFSGSIVNGSCYWISLKDVGEDMMWLMLAVSNSKFIEEFYDTVFNNRIYGGKRRYTTEYVKEFPLPNLKKSQSQEVVRICRESFLKDDFSQHDIDRMDMLIYEAFGLSNFVK